MKFIRPESCPAYIKLSIGAKSLFRAARSLSWRKFSAVGLGIFLTAASAQAGKTSGGRTSAPAAPSNLAATAVSSSQINLTWNNNAGNASGVVVQRAPTSSGPWSQIASLSASATAFSSAGLAASTPYYYRVYAFNSRGSAYSGVAGATTFAAQACNYSLSASSAGFNSNGGTSSVGVNTSAGCNWSATSSAGWITILSGSSGSGSGTVTYSVAANPSANSQSGTLTIAGQIFTVSQSGVGCSYTLSTPSASFGSGAGSGSVGVNAPSGCAWSASTAATWIHTSSSGNGNGAVNYSVDANSSPSSRSDSITVGGQVFSVSQAGASCSYALSSAGTSFGAASGSGSVGMTAGAGCGWSASSSTSWLHTSSSGSGNGTVSFTFDANSGSAQRSGSLSVAGQSFTVTQSGHLPPVANAGSAQTAGVGTSLTFNGSGSYANDGATLTSYNWTFGDLTSASGSSVSHAYSAAGTYGVNLTVSDSFGASSPLVSTSATITNSALPLCVSLTGPSAGATLSGTVTLSVSACAGAVKVEYYLDNQSAPVATSTLAPYGAAFDTTTTANGNHSFYAKAYNASGSSISSASVTANVNNQVVTSGPWNERLGGGSTDMGQAVATDAQGNIILAGLFYSSTDLGNGPLNSAGGYDIFLAKLSPAGTALWSKRFGGTGNEYVTSVALDASGNIFVGGYFSGTNDFGLGQHISTLGYDAYVAKFSSSGVPIWENTYGSTGVGAGYDSVTGVAVDTSGNVIVTGFFQGNQIDFGAGTQWNGAASYDSFLLKLAGANGANMWSRVYACDSDNQASGVAIDANGDIVVVGKLSGSVDLSNNTGVLPYPHTASTLATAGSSDIYVGKFASDGTYQWSERFGGGQLDNAMGVAVDSSRNIFIVGYFTASMNMGIGSLSTSGTTDPFVAKLTPSGGCVWARSLAGGNNQSPVGIAVDGSGNVSITGYFDASINLGAGTVSSSAMFQNTSFVAKYSGSASGINPANYLWSQVITGTGANEACSITTDPSGNVISTGYFMGNASLGAQTLLNAGATDIYLLRASP